MDDEDTREITERGPLVTGSSGLSSTALDYLRFTRMLLQRGELDGLRLLEPATGRADDPQLVIQGSLYGT